MAGVHLDDWGWFIAWDEVLFWCIVGFWLAHIYLAASASVATHGDGIPISLICLPCKN